jgi:hypothetical protein
MPKVSVIIPCYNTHLFLPEAIASIRAQTYRDLEIIVVNDGSTNPETLALLNQLPQDVQVVHKPNGGLSSARNYGIAGSRGEIMVALDSDDRFAPSFIEEAVNILDREKQTGIVSSHVQEFGSSSKVWRTTATDDLSFLTENRVVACSAFRRQCWADAGGYDEQMRQGCEDWDFWIRVTQHGWKVHVIPKKLFYYRKLEGSMMATETRPKMMEILDYMIRKNQPWYNEALKKAIAEKHLINKKNLTLRRIVGLFVEKATGKF